MVSEARSAFVALVTLVAVVANCAPTQPALQTTVDARAGRTATPEAVPPSALPPTPSATVALPRSTAVPGNTPAAKATTLATQGPAVRPTLGPTAMAVPPKLAGWEGVTVRTVCLKTEQSYPAIPGAPSVPADAIGRRLLERAGLKVTADDSSCDARLAFTLSFQALGADYSGGRHCFTGARATGRMQFSGAGHPAFQESISTEHPPPFFIPEASCVREPHKAPFQTVWLASFFQAVQRVWGAHIVIEALNEPDVWDRDTLDQALRDVGEEVVSALIEALSDSRWQVRSRAAGVLYGMFPKAKAALPALEDALADPQSQVRQTAALAIGTFGPDAARALPALVRLLSDQDAGVRSATVWALGNIGPAARATVPALIRILREDSSVRDRAAEALKEITGQNLGQNADRWQGWWEEHK